MFINRNVRGLVFAAVLIGAGASASPAWAQRVVEKHGSSCAGLEGNPGASPANPGGVVRDPTGIYPTPPFFAWVGCLVGQEQFDVSRVEVFVKDIPTNNDTDLVEVKCFLPEAGADHNYVLRWKIFSRI